MGVETLIYGYLAICASMIVFNCISVVVFRRRDVAWSGRGARLEREIRKQLARLERGDPVEEAHLARLEQELPHTASLLIFDRTIDGLLEGQEKGTWDYLEALRLVFPRLTVETQRQEPMRRAFFAYLLGKYRLLSPPLPGARELLMELLTESSLYCRENAMQAIYTAGDPQWVLLALRAVDQNGFFHHPKLLTDGLLEFQGDRQALRQILWENFESFSQERQVVILDYIRFSGGGMDREVLDLLADSRRGDELRFSCLRYFARYPYEPAFPLLLSFVDQASQRRWEYGAIAATALGAYPGEGTVDTLKQALHNPNWYVRFNAAKSLEAFHLAYWELGDVMEGSDRYAREILQYQRDLDEARRERKGALV